MTEEASMKMLGSITPSPEELDEYIANFVPPEDIYARISDVIARLQTLQKEHGDLVVCCAEIYGGGYGKIQIFDIDETISFEKANSSAKYCGEVDVDSIGISL